MQSYSLINDIATRPSRYGLDIWQSPALSFSAGNAFYAAATGVVGGFAFGALPAVIIQLGVTGWIARE